MLKELGEKDEISGLCDVLAVSGEHASIAPLEDLAHHPDPGVASHAMRALRIIKSRS
jgi:hypothetical protein